ncbi:MAG: UDP-2,3-diacylglucosamine diphosphatase LpxI [Desulfobacteraceae bacterium]|nr:UDP-2,3-diacylglucosamine diphosphatase LpxI [Desulfobacteraceae bacterium]
MAPSIDGVAGEIRIDKVGLIAGSGQFPLLFAHAALQAHVRVIAVGIDGDTNPVLSKYVEQFHLIKLGQMNRLIKVFRAAGITHVAMAGGINKTKLYTRIRPDWRAVKLLNRLLNKKDDSLLRAFAAELESEGIIVQPSTIFLPELLAPEGTLTRRKPNRREQSDITFGWSLAKAIGRLDIGQCLVVKDQAVLAVEGIDGTDATILRGGRLCNDGAIVVKVSKPIQDLRFDVPAVGFDTVVAMKRANARVLVLEAGKTLMFDREKMIDAADAAGISIVVQKEGFCPRETLDKDALAALESHIDLRAEPKAAEHGAPEREGAGQPVLFRKPGPDASRVAVIGVGYLGRFHAQKYSRLPEADLVAIVDTDLERAKVVGREVRVDALADYRELFGKVDGVSIVTPTHKHFAIAREFLEAGVNVLLEKPMTESVEEADGLIDAAKKGGAILQVGHLERFNSAYRAIRPRLRSPMYVEAYRLALFNERGLEVNVILDLMIHDIDILLNIIDSPIRNLHASGITVLSHLPDIASVRLEFENGAVANLTASRISIKNMRKLRIFQENCYFSADYAKKRAYAVYREAESDEDGFPQLSMEEFEIEEKDALEEEISSFLRCIRTGVPPEVDGEQGRRALEVALGISQQIEEQVRLRRALPERGLWTSS